MAQELGVVGLMNVQYAVKDGDVYVIEVNPRARARSPSSRRPSASRSRSSPRKVMMGKTLDELGFTEEVTPKRFNVKVPVFPFNKFPGTDMLLSPEMRSTGEVMGSDTELGYALAKAYEAAGMRLPLRGRVLLTVKDGDKRAIVSEARTLAQLGYELLATGGTWRALRAAGLPVERINKVHEGRPHIVDAIKNGTIDMVLNTPSGHRLAARRHLYPLQLHHPGHPLRDDYLGDPGRRQRPERPPPGADQRAPDPGGPPRRGSHQRPGREVISAGRLETKSARGVGPTGPARAFTSPFDH